MTKEECQKALMEYESISIGTLHAIKGHCNDRIYVNCYSDCNCSQDTFSSFEEFWDFWGADFLERGVID